MLERRQWQPRSAIIVFHSASLWIGLLNVLQVLDYCNHLNIGHPLVSSNPSVFSITTDQSLAWSPIINCTCLLLAPPSLVPHYLYPQVFFKGFFAKSTIVLSESEVLCWVKVKSSLVLCESEIHLVCLSNTNQPCVSVSLFSDSLSLYSQLNYSHLWHEPSYIMPLF